MKTRQAVMKDERRKKSDKKRIYTHIYIYTVNYYTVKQYNYGDSKSSLYNAA